MALHVGPLPPAEELARYDQCVERGAERLFKMAEIQSEHRRKLETATLRTRLCLAVFGQIFAFLLGVLGLGGGVWAVLKGHDWAGVTMSGAALVSLVTAFLRSYAPSRRNDGD